MTTLVYLRSYNTRAEAGMDVELLKEKGIYAVISSDDAGSLQPAAYGAQVMVPGKNYEEALRIIQKIPEEEEDYDSIYRDADHYDHLFSTYDDDMDFYFKIAETYCKSKLLEIGCGTGRLSIPLSEKGYDVTGIDISLPMLDRAAEKLIQSSGTAQFLPGDARTFELAAKFDLIIFPHNAFSHLRNLEDIESTLKQVRSHLTDDGVFVFDIFTPYLEILLREPNTSYPVGSYLYPEWDGEVTVTEKGTFDISTQIRDLVWTFSGPNESFERNLSLRIFFPQEIDAILKYNGFKITEKFGKFDFSTFDKDSSKQLFILQKDS